ncbi:MAG: T9SS type A sorting domain-containing protein [Bacteroidetes bacterium]|nr:T9SS type A sorting domain-containing protein [Bacteroidota bacterium]
MRKNLLFILLSTLLLSLATTSVAQNNSDVKFANVQTDKVKLGQNYPNPAVGRTYIEVEFEGAEATLSVYNVVGKLIEERIVTTKLIVLDVSQYEEGVYLYTLECNGEKITRRMTVKKQ